jgi:myo-inositol catabolism protein IolH
LQLAFETSLLRAFPLEKAFEEISNCGFTHVEIGLAHFSLADSTDEEARYLRSVLRRNNLDIAALCGIYPVSFPEENIRSDAVNQFRKGIQRASDLECSMIVSELNGDMDRPIESEKAFKQSIEDILPFLEKSNIVLCFEAHPGDFLEDNPLAVNLIKGIGSKHLRYLYCTPHSFILGDDVAEMVTNSKEVLSYVHLADSLMPNKTFFSGRYFPKVSPHQHLVPGRGDVDLNALFVALTKIDYKGFVTLDPFSHFDHPLEAMRESKAYVGPLLNAL